MLDQLSDEAVLEHNRDEARRLVRRKRQVLVGLVLLGVPLVILAPSSVVHSAWAVLLGLAIAAVAVIEVQRFMVFKKDRTERRKAGDTGSHEGRVL
jgi:hypothetical protein